MSEQGPEVIRIDEFSGELSKQEDLIEQLKHDKDSHQSQLITIAAQLSGIPAANKKEQLDKRAKDLRALKHFNNSQLGRSWKETAREPDANRLARLVE